MQVLNHLGGRIHVLCEVQVGKTGKGSHLVVVGWVSTHPVEVTWYYIETANCLMPTTSYDVGDRWEQRAETDNCGDICTMSA
jgi:hypothetical protein